MYCIERFDIVLLRLNVLKNDHFAEKSECMFHPIILDNMDKDMNNNNNNNNNNNSNNNITRYNKQFDCDKAGVKMKFVVNGNNMLSMLGINNMSLQDKPILLFIIIINLQCYNLPCKTFFI